MKLKKIGGLRKLLRGNSEATIQLETGYRNSDGQRTQVGIHQFLNFLEEKHADEFGTYLKGKRDEAKAKEVARKQAERNGEAVDEDEDED